MTCKYKNELFANKIYVYTTKGDIIHNKDRVRIVTNEFVGKNG